MRHLITLALIFSQLTTFSQAKDTAKAVSFITTFHISNATKDGYYLNGYVVEISYEQAQKLNHKKIKVTGKVSIVKGLNSQPKEYDEKGREIIYQGRYGDTKHILSPVIEIVKPRSLKS